MEERALKSDDSLHDPCTLVIANRFGAIREMSTWLEGKLGSLGLPQALIFNFDLCANEAVTNIVSYAYPQGGEHQIELRLMQQGEALSLRIEDDGIPFDPLARPPHVQPQSLEEAPIGGLGIDLMRSLMDECRYAREQERNVLTLTAYLRKPA